VLLLLMLVLFALVLHYCCLPCKGEKWMILSQKKSEEGGKGT